MEQGKNTEARQRKRAETRERRMNDLARTDFTRKVSRTTGAQFHAGSRLPSRSVSRGSLLLQRGRLRPPWKALFDEKQAKNT